MKLKKKQNSGQALLEYLLLFGFIITLSYATLRIGNQNIFERWQSMINIIVYPEKVRINP